MAGFDLKPSLKSEVPHDEGEPWLVSYADMVTLLLGFFVMLYSFSKVDESKFEAVTKGLAKTFKADRKDETLPPPTEPGAPTSEARQERALRIVASMMQTNNVDQAINNLESIATANQARKETLASIQKEISQFAGSKAIIPRADSGAILEYILPEELLFKTGEVTLTPDRAQKIRDLGASLAKIDNIIEVEVQGHSDSSPVKNNPAIRNNWTVSSERAGIVAEHLIAGGFPKNQMRIAGYSDTRPLVIDTQLTDNTGAQGLTNRRVHILIRKRR